ncbi:MAG: LytTR family DNA-binding domain-containing protein [Pseudomonadota bacterium]
MTSLGSRPERSENGFADRGTFNRVLRTHLRGKPVLIAYGCAWLFSFFYMTAPYYAHAFVPERVISHVMFVLVNYGGAYAALGALAHWAAVRNIPFVPVVSVAFLLANIAHTGVGYVLNPHLNSVDDALRMVARATALHVMPLVVLVLLIGPHLAKDLTATPETFPWWKPRRDRLPKIVEALPTALRGNLLRLESENQYVRVTTTLGSDLVRSTMKDACADLPDAAGWRIHRSIWIARSDVRAVVFVDGNPRLTDVRGRIWPMNRAMAKVVKAALEETMAKELR